MSELAGYKLEIPFGPAAGVLTGVNRDLLGENAMDCIRSISSIAWLGSFTLRPRQGNEPKFGQVYKHDPVTGRTINYMGLPNIGIEGAVELYRELLPEAEHYNTLLIPSVSTAEDDGEQASEVLPLMVSAFKDAGAKVVEVNYSCPNLGNNHHGVDRLLGYDLLHMREVDQAVIQAAGDLIISRKLPPYVASREGTAQTAAVYFSELENPAILNLSNSYGSLEAFMELFSGQTTAERREQRAGLSGIAGTALSLRQLELIQKNLTGENKVETASCIGVVDGQDVDERVNILGAKATSGVTIFFENEANYGFSAGQTCQRIGEQFIEAREERLEAMGLPEIVESEGEVEIGGA